MKFEYYQKKAKKTAIYPKIDKGWEYPALGLAGEVGELLNKLKKIHRDNVNVKDIKKDIKAELGDVLWYVAMIASEFKINLNDVAVGNLLKLSTRMRLSKLHGKGDYR